MNSVAHRFIDDSYRSLIHEGNAMKDDHPISLFFEVFLVLSFHIILFDSSCHKTLKMIKAHSKLPRKSSKYLGQFKTW